MTKADLIKILDNNKDFVQAKQSLPEASTKAIISDYVSMGEIQNTAPDVLVKYILYCMLIDLLANRLKEKIIGKAWTQAVGEDVFDLEIQDVCCDWDNNANAIIKIHGESLPDSRVHYVGGTTFEVSIVGLDLKNPKLQEAIKSNVRLYAYPMQLIGGRETLDLRVGEFTFDKLKELLSLFK